MHSLAFGSLVPFLSEDPKGGVDRKKMEMTQDVMANSLVYWVQDLWRGGFLGQGSKIYAMTSEGSTRVVPSYGVVSSAKAALESHVRQLAMELARTRHRRHGELHPGRRHDHAGAAEDPRVADDDRHHDEAEPDRPDDDARRTSPTRSSRCPATGPSSSTATSSASTAASSSPGSLTAGAPAGSSSSARSTSTSSSASRICLAPARPSSAAGSSSITAARAATRRSPRRALGAPDGVRRRGRATTTSGRGARGARRRTGVDCRELATLDRTRRPASRSSSSTTPARTASPSPRGANCGADLGPRRGRARATRPLARPTSSSSATRSRPTRPPRALAPDGRAGATTILNPAPATGLDAATAGPGGHPDPERGRARRSLEARRPERSSDAVAARQPGCRRRAAASSPVEATATRRRCAVAAVDTVGAGDTLNGVLAAGLAGGLGLEDAARRAVVAASLAVTRPGARGGMPTTAELEAALAAMDAAPEATRA